MKSITKLYAYSGLQVPEPKDFLILPDWRRSTPIDRFRLLGPNENQLTAGDNITKYLGKPSTHHHMMLILLQAIPSIDGLLFDYEEDKGDNTMDLFYAYCEIIRAKQYLTIAHNLLNEREDIIANKFPKMVLSRRDWVHSVYNSYQEIRIDFPFLRIDKIQMKIEQGKQKLIELGKELEEFGLYEEISHAIKLL